MTRALCFRCDWEGDATDGPCPQCGAELFRPAPRAAPSSTGLASWDRPPTRAEPPPAVVEPAEPADLHGLVEPAQPLLARRRIRHPRRTAVAALAAAVLAGVLWWRDSSTATSSMAGLHLSGTLVYAAFDRGGANERLVLLDLATGRISSGPLIRPVTDIVPSRAGRGWLGLIAGGYAYVLRGESPRDPPVLLGVGDVQAWAPGAEALVQQVPGRSANSDCPLSTISETDVRTGSTQVLYEAEECSGVLSIGSDQAGAVYLTLSAPEGAAVYQLGYKRLHLLLPGYAMLSVSPVGDMVVEPEVELLGPGPLQSGAALFWRGKGGPLPIASGDRQLTAEQVLAWSPDGSFAAVLGTLGGVRSVWRIQAGPGEGERVPIRIGPALPDAPVLPRGRTSTPDAAVGSDGTVYFSALGHLFLWRHDRRTELPLPGGAPAPAGPLAWLPPGT